MYFHTFHSQICMLFSFFHICCNELQPLQTSAAGTQRIFQVGGRLRFRQQNKRLRKCWPDTESYAATGITTMKLGRMLGARNRGAWVTNVLIIRTILFPAGLACQWDCSRLYGYHLSEGIAGSQNHVVEHCSDQSLESARVQ
jgi:hypothetical protein